MIALKSNKKWELAMSGTNTGALGITSKLLRLLIILNWLQAALILAGLLASFVADEWVLRALGAPPNQGPGLLNAIRIVMAIGILSAPLYHQILAGLLDIVRTVGRGDPFVIENADRLKRCALALLGLQLLRIVVSITANSVSMSTMPINIEAVSLGGWLAVLLLFVLAQVFRHGARMREDLAGTV